MMPSSYIYLCISMKRRVKLGMNDIITFYLTVNYKSSSKERLFLEKGWGIRDVRGPYLDTFMGYICISNEVLLPEIPTTISLVLSLSNRCPTSSILVHASAVDKRIAHNINRNGSSDFVFESVLRGVIDNFRIAISIPSVKTSIDLKEYSDIVAVDEITIERSR